MKNFFLLSLCLCTCMSMLASCGAPRTDAADSIKAIYDLYILGDTSGISSLGMTDEDIAAAQKNYDDSLRETIRANFAASGQEINENTLDKLCSVRKDALAKMSATAEIIEESDGKATVVIHTTYFNEASLDADAFYDAKEESQQLDFETQEEQQVFLMNAYTQNLIEAYQDVTPSESTTDITVECVIQHKTWVPANMSSFGSDLASAIAGQH